MKKYSFITLILFVSMIPRDGFGIDNENPFARTYLTVGINTNYPASFSQTRFRQEHAHPSLIYHYNLSKDWFLGIGGHFKIWEKLPDDQTEREQVAIWSMHHDVQRTFRLFHPVYLMAGTKLYYLVPSEGAVLPLKRDPDLPTEIGVGASISIMRVTNSGYIFGVSGERWRGTRSMNFHGVQASCFVGFSIGSDPSRD